MKKLSDMLSKITDGPDGPVGMFVINENEDEWDSNEEKKCNCESRTFTIKPLEGIEWNGKKIPLGSSKKDIENILGQPDTEEASFYYFENELRFDFDKNGTVEFIEFLGGNDGILQPELYGVKVFDIQADELYEILKEKNNGQIGDNEDGYAYEFFDLSIGVHRESIPENIEEMIADMEADGVDIEGNEDLEMEKKMAYHWATIGIGRKGYYH